MSRCGDRASRPPPSLLQERLAGRKVYLCWDMDVFDPSCAPGVATPTWEGLSAAEGLGFLRSLAGLDIVAVDVNTVSPPHDVGGMTAYLAGCVMLEGMRLVAASPIPRPAMIPAAMPFEKASFAFLILTGPRWRRRRPLTGG